MTKSKIDLSAAPNAAFQIESESGPSEPIKKAPEKKGTSPNLADAYTEKPRLNPEMIGKTLLDRMPNPTGWRILILPYQGKGQDRRRYFLTHRYSREKSSINPSWIRLKGRFLWLTKIKTSSQQVHGAKKSNG